MATLDTRIPLGITPFNLESPTDQMGKAMNLHAAQAQMQTADLQQQAAERALAEEQQLKALIQSGQPLTDRNLFPVVGPTRGAAILKGLTDLKSAQVKTEGELRAVMGSVIGAIKSLPENMRAMGYATAREGFIQKGWAKPEDIPEQYSAELLDQFQQAAMTAEQQGQHADRLVDNAEVKRVNDNTIATSEAERPGKVAASVAAQLSVAASRAQAATNQAEWDAVYNDPSTPKEFRQGVSKVFSRPAVQQAQRIGMTADKALAAAVAQQNANTSSFSAQTSRIAATRPSFQATEVLGDDGKLTTANYDSRSGTYTDAKTGKRIMNPQPAPSESARKDAQKFEQAGPILSAVSELSERINTLQGVAAKATGAAERQKAKLNLNDDVAEYEALIMGFTPLVARALGHTGVLTEQDVVSVRKLFPAPGDSKSLRDRKVARVNGIIAQLQGKEPSASIDGPADLVWDAKTQSFKKAGGQ